MSNFESTAIFLDCTLRDGGYYNNWDFSEDVIGRYLSAVERAGVDIVELGFRFIDNSEFMGACAFTTDNFIEGLNVPSNLTVAVMLNGSDLFKRDSIEMALEELFPNPASNSPVELVRIACHAKEFIETLPASEWLTKRGYRVGFNIMQIADRSRDEIIELAKEAEKWPIEVLYFADSMGGMTPGQASDIVGWLKAGWSGAVGIHTHDNMGLALQNTLAAINVGATWVDSTVTGMGRGPGNALTEELALEMADMRRDRTVSFSALFALVENDFMPLKIKCGWGKSPYYYLSGKYGIHPSYIQEMLADKRFGHDDVLSVVEALRKTGGKKFTQQVMHDLRLGSLERTEGDWSPSSLFSGKDILILGNGPSVKRHKAAIERFKKCHNPIVFGLNVAANIDESLVDFRLACHPLRLLADARIHATQDQPLITPVFALPPSLKSILADKTSLNFGLGVEKGVFNFDERSCTIPSLLVVAYALAVAASGGAAKVYLAGFDGFSHGDPRSHEMHEIFDLYLKSKNRPEVVMVTESDYDFIESKSVYGLVK
jgi:4-hydroxy 2-oxovalerate aldolase